MASIRSEWEAFAKLLPPKANFHQRRDMRIAFYAGATSIFGLMTNQVSEGDEVQEADLAMMDGLHKEIKEFEKELAAHARG